MKHLDIQNLENLNQTASLIDGGLLNFTKIHLVSEKKDT